MSNPPWLSAYGDPYDPLPVIDTWRLGEAVNAASELWEQLYHQGMVNTASYAATPELVRLIAELQEPDWNAYALVATIEEGRVADGNPPIPVALESSYHAAWEALLPNALGHLLAARDDTIVRSLLAVVAHAKGQHSLGALALCTEDERQEMLDLDA